MIKFSFLYFCDKNFIVCVDCVLILFIFNFMLWWKKGLIMYLGNIIMFCLGMELNKDCMRVFLKDFNCKVNICIF